MKSPRLLLVLALIGLMTAKGVVMNSAKAEIRETSSWALLTERLEKAMSEKKVPGFGLDLYDSKGQLVYSKTFGDFSRTTHYPIGSSSKWVTAAVLLSLVKEGLLTLDDTTHKWLGWEGEKGKITLRQLLSLTAGFHILPLEAPRYFYEPDVDLKTCAERIYREIPLVNPPGKSVSYGPVGFILAGRMAEVAAGKPWTTLFWEKVGTPLGFDREKTRYQPPQQLAGSLIMTMEEYGRFLGMVFNQGKYQGKDILTPALIQEQFKDQWPKDIVIKSSPYSVLHKSFHYGLGVWLECPDPNQPVECEKELIISSAGMFGWYPWIDTKRKYYGLLAMVQPMQAKPMGYIYAFKLLEEIRPLIQAVMERKPKEVR
jgi:D-alanyl-D-alanine-carboxypeptidase/D-alanyl-D-alanine-endopeptidase